MHALSDLARIMLSQAVGVCIIWLLVGSQTSQAIPIKGVHGARGGSIVLPVEQLPEGINVTSVIWKHNKDKAAEWLERDVEPTYFGMFKTRATLDMKTWALTLSDLQPDFSGEYSIEVNNKDPSERMAVTVFENTKAAERSYMGWVAVALFLAIVIGIGVITTVLRICNKGPPLQQLRQQLQQRQQMQQRQQEQQLNDQ